MSRLHRSHRGARAALAAALIAAGSTAHAGRSCEARAPRTDAVAQGMALAQRTAGRLDETGADVVVIARAGQDLRRWGLRWSHLGFAYRDTTGAVPVWRVVHKLNHCRGADAALYRQGLGQFFLEEPYEYAAAVVVLTPEVQRQLKPLLVDNLAAARLNEPAYSQVAYPWSTRYQQSNQWAIETLAMAQDPSIGSRERAQGWLRAHGYQPTTLRVGAVERLGAELSGANIRFDDHPTARRFTDRIDTVTADSVLAWLARTGQGGTVQVIR